MPVVLGSSLISQDSSTGPVTGSGAGAAALPAPVPQAVAHGPAEAATAPVHPSTARRDHERLASSILLPSAGVRSRAPVRPCARSPVPGPRSPVPGRPILVRRTTAAHPVLFGIRPIGWANAACYC